MTNEIWQLNQLSTAEGHILLDEVSTVASNEMDLNSKGLWDIIENHINCRAHIQTIALGLLLFCFVCFFWLPSPPLCFHAPRGAAHSSWKDSSFCWRTTGLFVYFGKHPVSTSCLLQTYLWKFFEDLILCQRLLVKLANFGSGVRKK